MDYSPAFRGNLYVTDTHSLLWAFREPHKLGPKALACFLDMLEGKAIIIVPTIVLAEAFFALKKTRLKIAFSELLQIVEETEGFTIFPVDRQVLRFLPRLEAIPEMHDRFIVATALLFGAAIIGKDELITTSGLAPAIWD